MADKMRKVSRLCFLFFALFAVSGFGAGRGKVVARGPSDLTLTYTFEQPTVSEKGIFVRGCAPFAEPGKPPVPYYPARILLPPDTACSSVSVSVQYRQLSEQVRLAALPEPVPVDGPKPPASGTVFRGVHPLSPYRFIGSYRMRGRGVAVVHLFPVLYDGSTGVVQFAERVTVTVSLKPDPEARRWLGRLSQAEQAIFKRFVDNSEDLAAYRQPVPLQGYEYVVITNEAMRSAFQPLVNDKISRGMSATIITMEDIANPSRPYYQPGLPNDPQRVKNVIRWCYQNWHTKYVLLGGDVDVIPIQYIHVTLPPSPYGSDWWIPSDTFYSNLESDSVEEGSDPTAEVCVGRAPVGGPQEAAQFVAKTLAFQNDGTARMRHATFIGLTLDEVTEGGDCKDVVAQYIPSDWTLVRLYQRDATYSKQASIDAINRGTQLINIAGHANYRFVGQLDSADVTNLVNTVYPIIYSIGCYSCEVDNRVPTDPDSTGEYITYAPRGAAAMMGNTRYGWYSPGYPGQGPSDLFDQAFFYYLFSGYPTLGEAFCWSKDSIGPAGTYWSYVYYEQILFGDPALLAVDIPPTPPEVLDGALYMVKSSGGTDNLAVYDFPTSTTTQLTVLPPGIRLSSPVPTEDLSRIVFSRSDDGGTTWKLWAVNSDGSGLECLSDTLRLSTVTANQTHGAISPDGTLLAFTAEPLGPTPFPGKKQLYLKELTGRMRILQLTLANWDCSYPVFLDDTRLLFKTRTDELEDFHLISTSGTDLRNLTNNSTQAPYFPRLGRPSLSADRTEFLYGKQTRTPAGFDDWHIVRYQMALFAEVQTLTGLVYFEADKANEPDPMPTYAGINRLVFRGEQFGGGTLLYATIFGSAVPYMSSVPDTDASTYPVYTRRAAPTQVVFVRNGQVVLRTPDGRELQLTNTVNQNNDPVLDRSGNFVAYSGNGIWVCSSTGLNSIQIDSTTSARYPAFSPDSRWVVYVKDRDLYAKRRDGSGSAIRLTSSSSQDKADPCVSPDGSRIAYSVYAGTGYQIYALPVQFGTSTVTVTGAPVNLTNDPGHNNFSPRYSPDGTRIVFVSTRTGAPAIYTMYANGSGQAAATIYPPPSSPAYPVFSPDGRNFVLYLSDGALMVANLDRQTATPLVPAIATDRKFDWGMAASPRVQIRRQFSVSKVDTAIPFVYNLEVTISQVPVGGTLIVTESIPSIADGALADWTLSGATWDGTPLPSSTTTGTLLWMIPVSSADEGTTKILQVTLSAAGDGPDGSVRVITGRNLDGSTYTSTRGDSYLTIGTPYMPVDADADWLISDDELLDAIDAWAAGSRIHGWPTNLGEWDYFLLAAIEFWANLPGYEYDTAGSHLVGAPRWKKR